MGPQELIERWLKRGEKWGSGEGPVVQSTHLRTHEGIAFGSDALVTGVVDNAQMNMLLWNPSGTAGLEAHTEFALGVGGLGIAFLYENPDVVGTGTINTSVRLNRVREREGVIPGAQWRVAQQAVVNDPGTLIGRRMIPGNEAAGPQAAIVPGTIRAGLEWVLDPQSTYLVVILNLSGATVFGEALVEWYETASSNFGSVPKP